MPKAALYAYISYMLEELLLPFILPKATNTADKPTKT